MPIRVRAKDGTVQTFPDGTSPVAVQHAMLAYDNRDAWGGLAGKVGSAVRQEMDLQGDGAVAQPDEGAGYGLVRGGHLQGPRPAAGGAIDALLLRVSSGDRGAAARQQGAASAESYLANPNVQAFLSVIRQRESGDDYRRIVGGGQFSDFSQHPGVYVKERNSTAAGAYQFNRPTWNETATALGLPDFSPHSQDLAALHLLKKTGALDKLLSGDVEGAIRAAGKRWDAFPNPQGKTISGRPAPDIAPIVDAYRARTKGPGG